MFLCHYFPPITRDLIETLFFVCAIWKYFRTSMRDNADWYIFYININNRTIFLCNMHGFRNMHIAPIAPYPHRSICFVSSKFSDNLYEKSRTIWSGLLDQFRIMLFIVEMWMNPFDLVTSTSLACAAADIICDLQSKLFVWQRNW